MTTTPYLPRAFRYGADEALLADIMPEAMWDWPWARTFLAEGADGGCLGAVLVVQDAVGLRVLVRSVPENLALERALLDEARIIARRRGFSGLVAWAPVAAGSAEEQAWRARGFTAGDAATVYEISLPEYVALLAPYVERLRESGQIPAGVRVLPLSQAPRDQVAALHASALGGNPEWYRHMLSRNHEQGGFYLKESTVLCMDDVVIALCLVRPAGDRAALVDAIAVHPGWRLGWANVLVRHASAEHGMREGFTHLRFRAGPQHGSGHRQAQRVKARIIAQEVVPRWHDGVAPAVRQGQT